MIFQFACRPKCYLEKTGKVSFPISPATFGDIRWNGSASSPDLRSEPESLTLREIVGYSVHLDYQRMGFFPNVQFPEVFHNEAYCISYQPPVSRPLLSADR